MSHNRKKTAAAFLVLGFLAACSPAPPPAPTPAPAEQAKKASQPDNWYNLKTEEISLDTGVGGGPSLTRNFYFILDGSGSMGEKPGGSCSGDQRFPTKMDGARWAVAEFLKQVPQDVNIGMIAFDNNGLGERVPLGPGNHERFLQTANAIQVGGGTPLNKAIHLATQKLVAQYQRQLGYGEYRLVVVTDGQAREIPEAALFAARHGMPIYTIGLCIGPEHALRQFSVSYRAADNFADLAASLGETLAELPSFDVATFDEPNP